MQNLATHDTIEMPLAQIRALCAAAKKAKECPVGCVRGEVTVRASGIHMQVPCAVCNAKGVSNG